MSDPKTHPGTQRNCFLSLALLILTAAVVSCGSLPEPVEAPSYAARLEELRAEWNALGNPKVAGFNYAPGIVRQTMPADVVVDPVTRIEKVRDEYVAALRGNARDVDLLRALRKKGIEAELVGYVPSFRLVQLRIAGAPEEALAALRSLSIVSWAGENRVQKANQSPAARAPASATPWFIADYDIPALQKIGRGKGVRVAVLDTGMDLTMPGTGGFVDSPWSLMTLKAEFQDKALSLAGRTERVIDHGTRVASMISAVAPEATIIPIQILGWDVHGDRILTNDLAVVEGIARAIASGAHIVNLSLGTDYSRYVRTGKPVSGTIEKALEAMLAIGKSGAEIYESALRACFSRNILVVCAAGNDGVDDARVQPLVAAGLSIVVGSIAKDGKLAGFSNKGPEIACYAPGVDVPLTGAGGNLRPVSGTSFSAPFVSGVLALARSAGLADRVDKAKTALRETNFEGRLSILPEATQPVFQPAALFRWYGAMVSGVSRKLDDMRQFSDKYRAFFILPGDDQKARFEKIYGWYQAKGSFDSEDREFKAALPEAAKQVERLADIVVRKERGYNLPLNMLMDAKLDAAGLEAVTKRLDAADLMGIIIRDQKYRAAVPKLHARLAAYPRDDNRWTLEALTQFQDPSSLPVARDWLKGLPPDRPFGVAESSAVNIVSRAPEAPKATELLELILASWAKYEGAKREANWIFKDYNNLDAATSMAMNLTNIRDERGLREGAAILGFLDAFDPSTRENTAAGERYWADWKANELEELVPFLHKYLPATLRYVPLASAAERQKQVNAIRVYFEGYSFP